MSRAPANWPEANQRALGTALAEIRARLEAHARRGQKEGKPRTKSAEKTAKQSTKMPPEVSALGTLVERFTLSAFERGILLLCAGVEFDSSFSALCAVAHGDERWGVATFGIALAVLPEPHWSALVPTAALRRWRLVELEPGGSLTGNPLRIDERVLHYLAGVPYVEPRLQGSFARITEAGELSPAQREQAKSVVRAWTEAGHIDRCPLVELTGNDAAASESIAATACALQKLNLHRLRAVDLPHGPEERLVVARLWEREAMLTESALLVVCDADPSLELLARARAFAGEVAGVVLVSSPVPLEVSGRAALRLSVDRPGASDQLALWRQQLGPVAGQLNGQLERVAGQFQLDARGIRIATQEAAIKGPREFGTALWHACRKQSRPALEGLAQRIEPVATWDDLILPETQKHALRTIVAQVRQRAQVCEQWGFARKGSRGLGIHALFAGPSGTGKTMAAEVIARDLDLDLHRIDLSALVSKYVGETEKNLRRVFDAAEHGGSILLFDEADALFGKRSEVRDSHDRYANIEVSYLLQRLESYRGLAILTSNMKQALDAAFTRRLRFIIHFAFPDTAQRLEIWRRIFPDQTPVERVDFHKLARLSLAGGHIRNLALNAAFLAADAGEPVRMSHLLAAAQSEYAKLEKPLSEAETGGWV